MRHATRYSAYPACHVAEAPAACFDASEGRSPPKTTLFDFALCKRYALPMPLAGVCHRWELLVFWVTINLLIIQPRVFLWRGFFLPPSGVANNVMDGPTPPPAAAHNSQNESVPIMFATLNVEQHIHTHAHKLPSTRGQIVTLLIAFTERPPRRYNEHRADPNYDQPNPRGHDETSPRRFFHHHPYNATPARPLRPSRRRPLLGRRSPDL